MAAKKKKKCKFPWLGDASCMEEPWWAFAPLYGAGGGDGTPVPPGGSPSPQSPAYPGAGGVNAPGVPAGPNSGMGPVTASADDEAAQAPQEDDMNSLAALGESLDAVTAALGYDVPDSPPQPEMPILVPQDQTRLCDLSSALLSSAFGKLADLCLATGSCDAQQRVMLTKCFEFGMQKMRDAMAQNCPWSTKGLPADAAALMRERVLGNIGY